jgi:hypothetical protein
MATASSLAGSGSRNAFDTIAASTTGSALVAARSGYRIRVLCVGISCGGTASTVQFKTATTAISPVFQNSISLPVFVEGWFQTNAGEALNVDTGAGSNTGVIVVYEHVKG